MSRQRVATYATARQFSQITGISQKLIYYYCRVGMPNIRMNGTYMKIPVNEAIGWIEGHEHPQRKVDQRRRIRRLWESGHGFAEIARRIGISRQRVYQIVRQEGV